MRGRAGEETILAANVRRGERRSSEARVHASTVRACSHTRVHADSGAELFPSRSCLPKLQHQVVLTTTLHRGCRRKKEAPNEVRGQALSGSEAGPGPGSACAAICNDGRPSRRFIAPGFLGGVEVPASPRSIGTAHSTAQARRRRSKSQPESLSAEPTTSGPSPRPPHTFHRGASRASTATSRRRNERATDADRANQGFTVRDAPSCDATAPVHPRGWGGAFRRRRVSGTIERERPALQAAGCASGGGCRQLWARTVCPRPCSATSSSATACVVCTH